MDQEKTGQLIAHCRKEKAMTQAALAEKLGITDRAVSKWETGKSLPDAGIMLELCELLGISVTELLVGERIAMENYKQTAETEMLELAGLEKQSRKKLLLALLAFCIVCIATAVIMIVAAATAVPDPLWRKIFAVTAAVILACCVLTTLTVEYKTGRYECPNCGHVYVPSKMRFLVAFNLGLSKKLLCPYCKQRGWHKKVFKK